MAAISATYFKDHLSDLEIREFKEAFSLFNKDGTGLIGVAELKELLNSVGSKPTEEELQQLIDPYDPSGKATLNFPAFLNMMAVLRPQDGQKEKDEMFNLISNHQEVCTQASFRHIVTAMGEKVTDEETQEMIRKINTSRTGQITRDEFNRAGN
jgi:calmodulin